MEVSGKLVRSSCERDGRETKTLASFGDSTHVLRLQGYMFFATGADLIATVERRLAQAQTSAPPLLCLILDMSLVPSMDVTSLKHFDKLRILADGGDTLYPHASFLVALCDVDESVRGPPRPTPPEPAQTRHFSTPLPYHHHHHHY